MSTKVSKLWLMGPPFAILVAAATYYAKFETARHWVDARFPWVAENIGPHLPGAAAGEPEPAATETAPPAGAAEQPAAATAPSPPPARAYLAADGTVRLDLLAGSKAAWPKSVTLRQPVEFPAVVGGKTVGKVLAPAGSPAHLVAIQGGKLGLEYRGGGAWTEAAATDLAEQLRTAAR